MKMTEKLIALLAQYRSALNAASKAHDALNAAVVASCGYKVGDKVEHQNYGSKGIGRIAEIRSVVFGDNLGVELIVRKIKKNGNADMSEWSVYNSIRSPHPAPVVIPESKEEA